MPDSVQKFKDELIIMIKDNPLPVIVPLQCSGAKPVVDILNNDVKFDRLLLNQNGSKVVKIKNNGLIPAKWKLTGVDVLPSEFTVTNTSGELQPTQETLIDIKF